MVLGATFEKFQETSMGMEIKKILEELLLNAASTKEKVGFVFLSRKGYWMFRSYRMFSDIWKDEYNDLVIRSDRFICKEVDEGLGTCKKIYVFDDTVSTGMSLYKAYRILRRSYQGITIVPVTAYMLGTKDSLKSELDRLLNNDGSKEYLDDFIDSLNVHYQATPERVGWMSSQLVYMFQQELLPYVIELPFLRFEGAAYKNSGVIVIPKAVFQEIQASRGTWTYVDNSYPWMDCLGSVTKEVMIHNAFLQYSDGLVEKIWGDNSPRLIVKCCYRELDDNQIAASFTPFAVMNSMYFDDAWKLFGHLYGGTEYFNSREKAYQNMEDDNKRELEKIAISIYRSIVYFFSFYILSAFKRFCRSYVGIEPVFDTNVMNENSVQCFKKIAEEMGEWSPEVFMDRLRGLPRIDPVPVEDPFPDVSYQYIEDDLQGLLGQIRLEILKRKRNNQNDAFLSIESIRSFVRAKRKELQTGEQEQMLLRMLLQMLNQSILGNSLWLDVLAEGNGAIIHRGFRYGENSDVVLAPNENKYISFAAEKLYEECRWSNLLRKDEAEQEYFRLIPELFRGLWNMAERKGYLDILIEKKKLEWNELYYSDASASTNLLIENKRKINSYDLDEIIVQNIYNLLEELKTD